MATINVSSTVNNITVDTATSTVTVTETPVAVTVNAASYSPIDSVNGKTGVVNLTTTDISEGTNQYFTTTRARASFSAGLGISLINGVITNTGAFYNDALARAALTVVDAGGDGALTYNNTTGVFTYTGPSPSEVRAKFSAGAGISIVNGEITNTAPYSDAAVRAAISAGTGISIVNGQITNTAPYSDTQVRAAVSGGTGVTYNSSTGQFSIGQAVGTTSDVTFNDVTVSGDLNVLGTLTTVNTADLTINDNKITLNAGETGTPNLDASLIVERGTSADVSLKWNESLDRWQQTRDGTNYIDIPVSTSELAEGTNQYFTNSRARSAVSVTDAGGDGSLAYDNNTGILTYTGPTSLDYRAAVSAANSGTGHGSLAYNSTNGTFTFTKVTGDNIRSEVADGRNLTYNGSTLDLDKALTSVNSVTAESATNLVLDGKTVQFKTRDVSIAANTLNFNSPGYRLRPSFGTTSFIAQTASATNVGTDLSNLPYYIVSGDVVSGSNQITNAVFSTFYETPIDITTINPVGIPILDRDADIFQFGVKISSISNITGTYDPDPEVNTQTCTITLTTGDEATSANALQDAPASFFEAVHYFRNSDSSLVHLVAYTTTSQTGTPRFLQMQDNAIYRGSTSAFFDGDKLAITYYSYSYTTQPNWQMTPRRNINLGTDRLINEHINVPYALGVGPSAISTNRGVPSDFADAIGINLYNPGTLVAYNGKTIFSLTQSTDNSYYSGTSTIERAGGQFAFNHIRGNINTAFSGIYGRNGDNLGRITWWSNAGSNATSLVSSDFTPASIHVVATEDHTGNASGGNTGTQSNASGKHGTGIALQYTPNSAGVSRPRTFLLANDKTVELRSVDSVVLKPVVKTGSNATDRALFGTVNHTWLTASDYVLGNAASNTTSMSPGNGAKVTVGMTSASGVDGNVGLILQRACGGNTANFELKLPSNAANTLQLVNNATSTTIATVTDSSIALNANTRITGGLRTYGEFAYTAGQITPAAADTIYAFPLDTTNASSGTSITNTSRVNISRAGFYKLIVSLQVKNLDNAADHVMRFWLRKNGTDVANSATLITPLKLQEQVVAMDWLVESDGDDYFEIVYYVNNVNVVFPYYAAGTTPVTYPGAPPIILNVIPIGA